MIGNIKKYTIPEEYNAKIMRELFDEIYREIQSKYDIITDGEPQSDAGKLGESRFDPATNKIWKKGNSGWVSTTLS